MSPAPGGADRRSTVDGLLRARRHDPSAGLLFEEQRWTWAEHVQRCSAYAAALEEFRPVEGPFHVGVLADNVPEFSFLIGGAALSGAILVALNDTRRGAALARDVRHTDCAVVLVDAAHTQQLAAAGVRAPVIEFESADWSRAVAQRPGNGLPERRAAPDDLLMLVFTSGTSGEPKAVRVTHRKIAESACYLVDRCGVSGDDVAYVAMPLFHSNALITGWGVALASGAALALRRRFSARGFLSDVRRFGATYANYVGAPLAYILATPQQSCDADNPLRLVYGNEGRAADIAAFGRRFGCIVLDGYGSSEGGIAIGRTPGTPPDALGPLPDGVRVVDRQTGETCPAACFGPDGALLNADVAVGELVNTSGPAGFAGYYNDPEADAARMGGGYYRSGDLAYVDEAGFCYFAGRTGDWLRVGGENMGTAPIERILLRHPAIAESAVYALPARDVGDQVAAAVVLVPGARLDLDELADFLAAQPDMSRRQRPTRLRIADALPRTASFKTAKRVLIEAGEAATIAVPSRG